MKKLLQKIRVQLKTSEQGQSLVEFAFMSIVLTVLLLGIVDVGRMYFTYLALQDAAGEGSNYAAQVPGTTVGNTCVLANSANTAVSTTVAYRVRYSAPTGTLIDWDTAQVCVNTSSGVTQGNLITVSVSATYQLITPVIGTIIGSQSLTLYGSSVAVINKP